MSTAGASLSLPAFLERAYGTPWVADLVRKRMLRSGQTLIAAMPIQAHATKDNRLLFAYRLEIDEGSPGAVSPLPLFLHFSARGGAPRRVEYQSLRCPSAGRLVPELTRAFLRVGNWCFLSAFPLDPEVRGLATLAKPGAALGLYNRALEKSKSAHAGSVALSLLGYRPEKRAVFKVRAVAPDGRVDHRVLKLYRKNEANRIARFCTAVVPLVTPKTGRVAWPLGVDPSSSALVFPFVEGQTLHDRIEQGMVQEVHFHGAGALLRELHQSLGGGEESAPPAIAPLLRSFRRADELAILDRWRRLLKQGGHPLYGSVSRFLGVLDRFRDGEAQPSALVHRDFYPKQIMVPWAEMSPVLIDVDTMAWGPAAVDVGNFLAHVELCRFSGVGETGVRKLRDAFLNGYGHEAARDPALAFFELSSMVRVLCLTAVSPRASEMVEPLTKRCRKLARALTEAT